MDQRNVNLKSRILRESVEHQVRKANIWQHTWTKRPRYDGQATFDSKNGMRQVPFAKLHAADQPLWRAPPSLHEDPGQAQPWDDPSSGNDPIMRELTEMQRESSPDSGAQYKGKGNGPTHEPAQSQERQCQPGDHSESTRENDRDFKQSDAALYANDNYLEPSGKMLLQPETRPITQDQLVNEVKSIYAGLVMVEQKCIEIDQHQSIHSDKLSDEQWQTLIRMHRTLLYEHHDFFLATQHPSASPALRRLATNYAMPSRMFRHGIHAFLELLHQRLPDSFDYMLAYIDLAGSIVTASEDTLPEAEKQWADCRECLESYREILSRASYANASDDSPRDHSSGGRTAQPSPSSWSSIPTLWSSPRDNVSIGDTEQVEEFGDWYLQDHPPPERPNVVEFEKSYSKMPQLTKAVLCVLSGWLVYRQVITMDFNIYSKVFHMLSLSGMTPMEDS